VANGGFLAVGIEQPVHVDPRLRARPDQPGAGRRGVLGAAIDLGAVAGGDEHGLRHAGLGGEVGQGRGLGFLREGELLADLQGSALVVDAEDVERHGVENYSRFR